jgi:hypothetical protein
MELWNPAKFLDWAATLGIGPASRDDPGHCLVYAHLKDFDRFWTIPERGGEIPFFLSHLLAGLEPWSRCALWPREETWCELYPHSFEHDKVAAFIQTSAGIPQGHRGAAVFERCEAVPMISVMMAATLFGSSTQSDLFVLPDHGRRFLYISHHDVIHVESAEESLIEPFVAHMATEDYHLPSDLPDWTFERPNWMNEDLSS